MSGPTHDIKLSKKLSYLLRHGAEKEGLSIRNDGYARVQDILNLRGFRGVSTNQIRDVVEQNEKQRFSLRDDENGELMIRAKHGHSMTAVDSESLLQRVTDPAEILVCIHGTTMQAWQTIERQGLRKMGRNNIHFATGDIDSGHVISGMRRRCEVKIFIDTAKAMRDGVLFYRSENGVILCPGVGEHGTLDPKYFSNVKFSAAA